MNFIERSIPVERPMALKPKPRFKPHWYIYNIKPKAINRIAYTKE